jgi:hypothetical protein
VGLRKKEPQGAADDKKHQKKQESAWQGYGDGTGKGVGIGERIVNYCMTVTAISVDKVTGVQCLK